MVYLGLVQNSLIRNTIQSGILKSGIVGLIFGLDIRSRR